MTDVGARLLAAVCDVADFPEPGITFKDLQRVYADPALFGEVVGALLPAARAATHVVGIEARGFLTATPLALAAQRPFVALRKAGKLPGACRALHYDLEYASATIEVQEGAIGPGDRVLLVDDVLATGGTAAAACALLEQCGASVSGVAVLLELSFLHGRDALAGREVTALATV